MVCPVDKIFIDLSKVWVASLTYILYKKHVYVESSRRIVYYYFLSISGIRKFFNIPTVNYLERII